MKPLLFLHGWAQSSRVWYQQKQVFTGAHYLNLPGHGGAKDVPADAWVEHLTAQLPDEPCMLVGWSLGGSIAMEIARRFPGRIAGLALIGSTPCFRAAHDWPHGCDEPTFATFKDASTSDSARALTRFFALMLHGDGLARSAYNQLAQQAVDKEHPATAAGLAAGLELLVRLDLRCALLAMQMPVLLVHGEQDAIVAVEAGRWLARHIPGAQAHYLDACGHVPFLSQPEKLNTLIKKWWQQ